MSNSSHYINFIYSFYFLIHSLKTSDLKPKRVQVTEAFTAV